ncbi:MULTISPECIES: Arm DNA-binding domain-containing protein [unclassified Stenotrophomonas]|uniref:Arm DNA-binding domain-containing protein n=1 Tax=unclassified Stenotrophomonas TaxID=196198 RepID=UPI003467BDE4
MLTDTKLRSLKAKAKLYRVADTNGLCIEVRPTGARFWRYRYRFNGKPTMAPLGQYPAVSLERLGRNATACVRCWRRALTQLRWRG